MTCPIWPEHKDAEIHMLRGETGGIKTSNYYRCGTCGDFEMSELAKAGLHRRDEQERWALSWATRNATEQGAPLRLMMDDLKTTVESVSEPSPSA